MAKIIKIRHITIDITLEENANYVNMKLAKDEYQQEGEATFEKIDGDTSKNSPPDTTKVVGYGMQSTEDFELPPPTITGSSEAGVKIRSRNGGPNPLYLLKQENTLREISAEELEKIKPEAIQSIAVYKNDAESLSKFEKKYGAKAANGVIILTLK